MKSNYLISATGVTRLIAMWVLLGAVSVQAQQVAPAPKAAAPEGKEAPGATKGKVVAPSSQGAVNSGLRYLEGVWAEEMKGDEREAIAAYERTVAAFEAERPRAARAVEQLAEALLKQGRVQEAQVQYLRLAREFSDLPGVAQLAESRGVALGMPGDPGTSASIARPAEAGQVPVPVNPKVRALLDEELALVERQIELVEQQVKAGQVPSIELLKLQREALQMKQRIAAAERGGSEREE